MSRFLLWSKSVHATSLLCVFFFSACTVPRPDRSPLPLIPIPLHVERTNAEPFIVSEATIIQFDPGDSESERIAMILSDLIGNSVESMPAVLPSDSSTTSSVIRLSLISQINDIAAEGYLLSVTPSQIELRAQTHAGLFYGVQTIRQLLPDIVEYTAAFAKPLPIPAVEIRDEPRFAWRGMMLDVARHFLPASDVKRFIDLMTLYKMNRLHLHLSDDQGWRIEIPGRERLTQIGGQLQVGGKGGGFYTTEDYADIVQYAADRFVTIVPEIDLPGHTNSALASYAELNCDGIARELYTGILVGFSSVCPDRDATFDFVEDVVREISRLTPTPFFHVGGDEVQTLTEDEYVGFVERVQSIVATHNKQLVGWDEVASADLSAGSHVQLWRPLWPDADDDAEIDSAKAADIAAIKANVQRAIDGGVQFVISPANKIYLDMKYDATTAIGLTWAGTSSVQNSYDWDVADVFSQIPESSIAGIEGTLWSESLGSIHDFEYMAFPRLPGVAEIGWSAMHTRDWSDYRIRVAEHADRWNVLGINYFRAPGIPWSR